MALALLPGAWATSGGAVIIGGGGGGGGGGGDVVGPGSATDNAVARYDGATGKLIQNSVVIVDDVGVITGVSTINGVTVETHASRHENGGADEISVAGLSGVLADNQNAIPAAGIDTTAIHDNVAAEISAVAAKATPTTADYILIEDAAAADAKKSITIGDLPAQAGADSTAIHDNVAAEISAITAKATPTTSDYLLIEDAAAGNAKKSITIGDLPSGGGGTELDAAATSENLKCSRTGQTPSVSASDPGQVNLGSEATASHGTSADYATISGGFDNIVAGNYGTVSGGQNNDITSTGANNVIGGGYGNVISGTAVSAVICGGGLTANVNTTAANYSFIGGGLSHDIPAGSDYAAIVGGLNHTIGSNSDYSVICGGQGNSTGSNAQNSFVGAGSSCSVSATGGAVVGGASNAISGLGGSCFIGSGLNNTISSSGSYNTIGGGEDNTISGAATHGFVGGGDTNIVEASMGSIVAGLANTVTGPYGFIGGGTGNDISSSSNNYSTIVAGGTNVISGTGNSAFIGGGQSHTNSSAQAYTFIGGGFRNDVQGGQAAGICCGQDNEISSTSGQNFVGGGNTNKITSGGWSTIPGGHTNTVAGSYSWAAGRQGSVTHDGTMLWADSTAAAVASVEADQAHFGVANGVRISHTTEEDGFVQVVAEHQSTTGSLETAWSETLTDDTAMLITARIVGRKTSATHQRGTYILNALVYRAAAGSATIEGSVDRQLEIESDAGWNADITVSSNDVRVQVHGNGATVNWRVTIQKQQVS